MDLIAVVVIPALIHLSELVAVFMFSVGFLVSIYVVTTLLHVINFNLRVSLDQKICDVYHQFSGQIYEFSCHLKPNYESFRQQWHVLFHLD